MNQGCAKLFTRISSLVLFITFLWIRKSARGPGVIFSVEVWLHPGCSTARVGDLCVYNNYFFSEDFFVDQIIIMHTLLLSLITLQWREVWGPVSPIHFSQFGHVQFFATSWIAAHQASLCITNSGSLSKLMCIESVMPSSHLTLCHPLLLLPSIPPSIRVFSNESTLPMRWPKYWSFSLSISPSSEHPGLVSFRMDWLDLLAVQGTRKSLLQQHSSKASILRRSAFFTIQLSHPYMTTGKTIALTRQTFVGKVISVLFNVLSRSVITFLPRSECLLISWLQSPSAVILEPPKMKSDTVSTVSPSISHEVMGPDAMILVFWMLNFKPTFSFSPFTFIKRLFSSSSLSAIRVVSSAYFLSYIFPYFPNFLPWIRTSAVS